jgi:hypothetical protein
MADKTEEGQLAPMEQVRARVHRVLGVAGGVFLPRGADVMIEIWGIAGGAPSWLASGTPPEYTAAFLGWHVGRSRPTMHLQSTTHH